MLSVTYYAQNDAGIIGWSLYFTSKLASTMHMCVFVFVFVCVCVPACVFVWMYVCMFVYYMCVHVCYCIYYKKYVFAFMQSTSHVYCI